MKHWGVWLGGFVLVYEVFALATDRHTWTDYVEDADLLTALPVIVFTGWIVNHLGKALINGPSHPHSPHRPTAR